MKIHYVNILLFALPLNIFVILFHAHNKNKPHIALHTPTKKPIKSHRTLCECELYTSIYDNDQEMKKLMEHFDRQTSQRFEEYNERMMKNRQKCREQCDKEIQKIILKDKLEKQMAQQLTTLETKIDTDDIPTCVCEKSLADKVEKTCLKCGGVLGGGVTPAWGLLSGIVYTGWKAAALAAAKKLAAEAGAAKGLAEGAQAGIKAVMNVLVSDFGLSTLSGKALGTFIDATNYKDVSNITTAIYNKFRVSCVPPVPGPDASPGPFSIAANDLTFCYSVWPNSFPGNSGSGAVSPKDTITNIVNEIVADAKKAAGATTEAVTQDTTATLTAQYADAVNATYASYQTPIIASIVAIVVIVLVMVIIYLILRYRRKKKMKKKLQYIKLLE